MDLHPLVVHFPIGLLLLYGFIELVQVFPFAKNWKLTTTKAILLFVWFAGTVAALKTGEIAEENVRHTDILELHDSFAHASYWLYLVIVIIYGVYLLDIYCCKRGKHIPILSKLSVITGYLYRYGTLAVLALIGILLLTATGALGGAMVYGPDPIAEFVIGILGR